MRTFALQIADLPPLEARQIETGSPTVLLELERSIDPGKFLIVNACIPFRGRDQRLPALLLALSMKEGSLPASTLRSEWRSGDRPPPDKAVLCDWNGLWRTADSFYSLKFCRMLS
jgi:hypothetical protein